LAWARNPVCHWRASQTCKARAGSGAGCFFHLRRTSSGGMLGYGPGVPPAVEIMTICTDAKDGGRKNSVCCWHRRLNVAVATTSPELCTAPCTSWKLSKYGQEMACICTAIDVVTLAAVQWAC